MQNLKIRTTCPDCGVPIGNFHKPNCAIEICPFCGVQMLQDECIYKCFKIDLSQDLTDEMIDEYEKHLRPHLLGWDGALPGVRECREYGFFCKRTQKGWEKCSPDDPDAKEDLAELARRTYWDKEKKRFVLRSH